jgi:adenylate cyclase
VSIGDGWLGGSQILPPKQLGRTVLLSRAFADFVKSDFDLERVGEYPVRGFNDPIELFAYHG